MQGENNLFEDSDLRCTPKGVNAIMTNTHLKGRLRQYCLLLLNEDPISLKIRHKLKEKIDISYLLDNGYVTFQKNDDSLIKARAPLICCYGRKAISVIKMMSTPNLPTVKGDHTNVQDNSYQSSDIFRTSISSSKLSSEEPTVSPLIKFVSQTC